MGPGIYNIYAGLFPGLLIQKSLLCLDGFHLTWFTQSAVDAGRSVFCETAGEERREGREKKKKKKSRAAEEAETYLG